MGKCNYTVRLKSLGIREEIIGKAKKASKTSYPFYEYKSQKIDLPVVRLDLDLPIYRMENFRTFTYQSELLFSKKLKKDHFKKGQEVESVQQEQHEILVGLAKKGVAGSVSPVIDVLAKEGQREPILITSSGVVVNGNRRLAAMRELYAEGSQAYDNFKHIDCAVLPEDATDDDIYDIEGSLQGKPETKLEYDWIGDAEMIHSFVSRGKTTEEISNKLNRSEKEIKNALEALNEAALYLKDWAGADEQYGLIKDDGEQFFKDLPKCLDKKDEHLKQASRVLAWNLYENRSKLSGRLYNYNAAFGTLASDVLERFCDSMGLPTTSKTNNDSEGDEDFDIDIDVDEEVNTYEDFVEFVKKNKDDENVFKDLRSSCEDAIESRKSQISGEAAEKAVTQAHSKLAAVDLARASRKTYSSIDSQLSSIESVVEKLKNQLAKLMKK